MTLPDTVASPPALSRRHMTLLMPAMLAILGMLIALTAATMGQDKRRARDTLQMRYDLAYWENQQLKLQAGQPVSETPDDIVRGLAIARDKADHPPWEYGYAKFGRQFTAWDAYRYEEIVEQGYTYHPPGATPAESSDSTIDTGGPERRVKDVVWFPLYPLLAAALVRLLHIRAALALTAVSWACCLGASVLVFLFVRRHVERLAPSRPVNPGKDTSLSPDRAALLAVMLLLFGPCAIFLYANFTESLFLLLLAAFLLCLQSKKWWQAAAVAGIASACRSQGVLLGPVLAVVFLLHGPPGNLLPRLARAFAMGVVSSIGLASYMLFLGARFGDPLAFMHAQVYWNVGVDARHLLYAANPLHALEFLRQRATAGPMDWPRLWEALCLFWPPVVLLLGRRQLSLELTVLGWVMWALPFVSNSMAGNPPLQTQWMSMGRFMAVLLPAQLILAKFLADRPRMAPFMLIPSIAAFAVFAFLYGNGDWIG